MTAPDPLRYAVRERLAFLLETVALEAEHLQATDGRLFAETFTAERAASLRADALLVERLDAFAARFARLQDTAGDKFLPALLTRLGKPLGSVLDNLDRAARLGLNPGCQPGPGGWWRCRRWARRHRCAPGNVAYGAVAVTRPRGTGCRLPAIRRVTTDVRQQVSAGSSSDESMRTATRRDGLNFAGPTN